jgi:hypothetical protein
MDPFIHKLTIHKMAFKIIDNFDSSFTLEAQAQETLFNLLQQESFIQQICQQSKSEKLQFTKLLFQPVPYSLSTPKGMPAELEKYHDSDDYVIINVPPNVMFTAKIFQPSRLCAIYQKIV